MSLRIKHMITNGRNMGQFSHAFVVECKSIITKDMGHFSNGFGIDCKSKVKPKGPYAGVIFLDPPL